MKKYLTYLITWGKRRKSVHRALTTLICSAWLGGVLELYVGKFWILRVEATKLMHIYLKVGSTKRAVKSMTYSPQSPKYFAPRLQL